MIVFLVPGPVRGKGRPRFVRATGRTYTDEQTASYENLVKILAIEAMGGLEPLTGPLALTLHVQRTVPASWSAKRRAAADWVASKPDLDNVVKLYKDAMNGVVYPDDAAVASVAATKRYGAADQVIVEIRKLP